MQLLCEKLLNVSPQYSKINGLTLAKGIARAIIQSAYAFFLFFLLTRARPKEERPERTESQNDRKAGMKERSERQGKPKRQGKPERQG